MEIPSLDAVVSTWSLPRLRQALAFAGDGLEVEDREALARELERREGALPPDPVASGLAEQLQGWSHHELRAAYLDPHDPYDWRQRGAIEAELALREAESEIPLLPAASEPPTVRTMLNAGFAALSARPGLMLGRTFLLGLLWIVLTGLLGAAGKGGLGRGVGQALLVPLYLVACGAVAVWVHHDLVRAGLGVLRGTVPASSSRSDRLGAWLIWGLLWLVFLFGVVLAGVIQGWLAVGVTSLWGLALGAALIGQLLVVERKLTPLAALRAVAGMLRTRPLRLLWLGGCWTLLWLGVGLSMVVPLCGLCLAPIGAWIMTPVSAAGWAQAYASLSGGFPPLATTSGRWSFPGEPLPAWLLPVAAGSLTVSLWACSGGAILVTDVAENLGLEQVGLAGWAPLAALGAVACLPVLVCLALLALAGRIAGGVVLDADGLRVDVTGRWSGRAIPWARVRGFRLGEQGVRFLLTRRPWTLWTGPLVPVRELEAHALVAQLEAWGVRRDGGDD